ncbi:hypothetical protein [Sinomonas sp. P10A9]|uniref:O-glycosyl hydrolase n=1 Tax=Sinomonas puerhi TaxID=3238584 RepID=A0AB39L8N5_9MICC
MVWRVIIEKADWEPTEIGPADVIDDSYYRRIYETPKMRDLWDTIAYIESSKGQTVSLSVMGAVSPWMGGTQVLPEKEDFWVRMIASLLDYGRRQRGLTLSLVSPLNEPDTNGIEGPNVGPSQMTELLGKLGRRLDALGMGDVRFVVPDTSSAQGARDDYVPALVADTYVSGKIARIGIHTYSGDAASVPDAVSKGAAAGAGVWATEFNAWCDGCDSGAAPADTWDQAFGMARMLLSLVGQGVNGAQMYDAWDGYYEHHGAMGYWGALKYDPGSGTYSPRSAFSVLSLFIRALPSGTVHVGASGAPALEVQAFLDEPSGQVNIVGANPTRSAQRFVVTAGGAQLHGAELALLGPDSAVAHAAIPSVRGGGLAISVPANDIFWLKASLP